MQEKSKTYTLKEAYAEYCKRINLQKSKNKRLVLQIVGISIVILVLLSIAIILGIIFA